MDYGLWPCFKLPYLSSGLMVEAKCTVMNSTWQHAETLGDTDGSPGTDRRGRLKRSARQPVMCGSIQAIVLPPGEPADPAPSIAVAFTK